jgi:hypothetical protein
MQWQARLGGQHQLRPRRTRLIDRGPTCRVCQGNLLRLAEAAAPSHVRDPGNPAGGKAPSRAHTPGCVGDSEAPASGPAAAQARAPIRRRPPPARRSLRARAAWAAGPRGPAAEPAARDSESDSDSTYPRARRGAHWLATPARAPGPPGATPCRRKHDIHGRNAQSARFPANPVCGSRAQRLPGPRRAHVPMIGRAGHTRLGARRPSVSGGRCPEVYYGVTVARVRTMPSDQEESARDSSLWQ